MSERITKRVASGLMIMVAGASALSGCGSKEDPVRGLMTLQEHREADVTPLGRYLVDYGGKVSKLIDRRTGDYWHDNYKEQCLANSPFGLEANGLNADTNDDGDILTVSVKSTDEQLVFTGYNDITQRLKPGDTFTAGVLASYNCVVTDY